MRLLVQHWREQKVAAKVAAPVAAEMQATVAAEPDTVVAAEPAMASIGRSRRRHRVRRRANGAPRSCVLQSGRWINLPRARRAATDTIANDSCCTGAQTAASR